MSQSAFTAFRALLPSASYSAGWSNRVWQLSADCNGCLAHFFEFVARQTPIMAATHFPASSNIKKMRQLGCCTRLDGVKVHFIAEFHVMFTGKVRSLKTRPNLDREPSRQCCPHHLLPQRSRSHRRRQRLCRQLPEPMLSSPSSLPPCHRHQRRQHPLQEQ